MKVIFLGTSSSIPTRNRCLPSVALIHKSETILFDCGEGTQMQIQHAQLRPSKIHHIFISHLHGDHFFGLPGLLTSQQMQGRRTPIKVYGPPGLRQFVDTIKQLTSFEPDYTIDIFEARPNQTEKWELNDAVVHSKWLDHTLPTLGFRYQEKTNPGKFNIEEAKRLGIPAGPLRQVLQSGQKIVLANGVEVRPEHVLGPPRPGKVVTYCVDTRACDTSIELAHKADLLIHDATFDMGEDDRARQTGHSTVEQAAQIAVKAGVKRLALTHVSARYSEEDDSRLLEYAKKVFASTVLVSDLQTLYL
jgi:ribonuclease Z